ncbi:MAG TPA: Hsp70 family protein [Polyangiaceae bacterium]|nr:Hsp70 family protein [Polyangiaceae bacterium]
MTSELYLGIDLGTTNSAAALFDGENVDLVRNAEGASITPSVVRIDARGNVTVGAKARRAMDRDPENVRAEFKRLMGTPHPLAFAASKVSKRPEELSAHVLRAIREDVKAQRGFAPARAVISVPALFELPQTAATSEAARLAGFERVEMIQEPIASAIASGWKAEAGAGPWLVYDLGGGTFDASLLETQDGLLRVVGHDGDNFLGGRDFDAAVVDWAIEQAAAEHGVRIARDDPAHATALRRLRLAAEEAKIELSRAREAELTVDALDVGGASVDLALVLGRDTLEALVTPLLERSLAVCRRLLARHGIVPGQGSLTNVVLVGGPTAMPLLRARVREGLCAPFGEGLDPMTLVAQGAALYAASAGLGARPSEVQAEAPKGKKVWLQYPAMSSDLSPFVVGRLVDMADRASVAQVVIHRAGGGWSSAPEAVDAEGTFAVMVSLAPRAVNEFRVEGRAADGAAVALSPGRFSIVHGVTVGDPPLSRSIGVALATNHVRSFFERGTPLPIRRMFPVRTVESLSPADPQSCLRVPIVQGEFPLAHLCRLVGTLEVRGAELRAPLPSGSVLDVTIELDRGGRLSASARVEATSQVFDSIAHLVAGSVPVAELGTRLADLGSRLRALRARAFGGAGARVAALLEVPVAVGEKLMAADALLSQGVRDEQAARGGDLDAAEKTRRTLIDLDALLAEAEAELAWPDLDARLAGRVASATSWVAEFGTPDEKRVLGAATASAERARSAKNHAEIERQLDVIRRLGDAAYLRSPGAWDHELDHCASRAHEASDVRRAAQLVDEGRAASRAGNVAEVERAVRGIWALLPARTADRALGHQSGVR